MLDIRLLGQPEIRREGDRLPFPRSRKTRALLAYLIVTGRTQSRQHLCDLLWQTADDPRASLRWSLSKLRPLLDERLKSDRRQVSFDSAGMEIDVLSLRATNVEEQGAAELNDLSNLFKGEFTMGSQNGLSIQTPGYKPVVAVLPFENLSNDVEQQYFVDGITMDVTAYLSKFRAASVISRGFQVDENESLVDVAGRFGVRYLVKGGVIRVQDRIRLSVQLVDSETGQNVWGEVYDRQIQDLLQIRDELSHKIVSTVEPEFTAAEAQRAGRKALHDLNAWEHYMRATWHLSRFTWQDNQQARLHAERAIELDPEGAGAYAIKAVTHLMDAMYGWSGSWAQAIDLGRRTALVGLRLDDRDAQVVRTLGLVNLYAREHDQAKRDFLRAIDLNPDEAENYALLGYVIGLGGDYEGATMYIQRALELSPRDQFRATWYSHHAMVAVIAGEYQKAVDLAKATLAQNPEFLGGFRTLAVAHAHLGHKAQAKAAVRDLTRRLPELTLGSVAIQLPFSDSASRDLYIKGLRIAGLPE